MCSAEGIRVQNMRGGTCSTELDPFLELLENVLFSIVSNKKTLGSGNVVNGNKLRPC